MIIDLPKKTDKGIPQLSYTQVSMWMKSKREYIRKYFLNEPDKGFTDFLDHGKKVGAAIETNNFSGFSDNEIEALCKVERLDIFEKKVILNFKEHDFVLIGYIDSCKKDLERILDYKVGGKDKLKEYEKEDYIQLILYALAIQQETGKLPKSIGIEFIERTGNPFKQEPLLLTGNVIKLNLDISEERLKFALDTCIRVAGEISQYYKIFKKLNTI